MQHLFTFFELFETYITFVILRKNRFASVRQGGKKTLLPPQ